MSSSSEVMKPMFQPWLFSNNYLTFKVMSLKGKCESASLSSIFIDNPVSDELGVIHSEVTVCNLGVPLANITLTQVATGISLSFDLPILPSRASFATVPFSSIGAGESNIYAVAGFFSDSLNQDSLTTGQTHSSNNYTTGDAIYSMVYFGGSYSNQWLTFDASNGRSTQCTTGVVDNKNQYTGEIGACINSTTVSYSYAIIVGSDTYYGSGEVPYIPYFVSVCNETAVIGFLLSPSMDQSNLWFNSPIN
jgi:hypothetical protein